MESYKFEAYKKKLQGVCDENDLVFRFRCDSYPLTLTIRPVSGVEEQMTLLEKAEDSGYTSPDAALIFIYKDGVIDHSVHGTFTISDVLFTKIRNLFRNMHFMWLQFFHRDVMDKITGGAIVAENLPRIEEGDKYTPGTYGALTEKQLTGEEPIEGTEPLEVDDIGDNVLADIGTVDDIEVAEDTPEGDVEGEYPYEE